jgi:hypothetical protein
VSTSVAVQRSADDAGTKSDGRSNGSHGTGKRGQSDNPETSLVYNRDGVNESLYFRVTYVTISDLREKCSLHGLSH